jgi:hypothetical protein
MDVRSKAGPETVSPRLNPGAELHLVGGARSYCQCLLGRRVRCPQREGGTDHQNDPYHRTRSVLHATSAHRDDLADITVAADKCQLLLHIADLPRCRSAGAKGRKADIRPNGQKRRE